MPDRSEVYKVIDGERDYQDALGPDRVEYTPEGKPREHSVGDYIVMLRAYIRRAETRWTMTAGDAEALKEIRKIAAIAVRCMEDHGAIPR